MKILMTGFEPFDNSPLNPSQMLVKELTQTKNQDIQLLGAILPVDQEQGPKALLEAVDSYQPNVVLCFGLAMGRAKISLERVALNLMDYRIPDNAGNQVTDQPIVLGGPAAYFSTLPIRTIYEALIKFGIPAELSLSAGAYLCNQVFYALLHNISIHQKPIQAGFVHLPALPEQAAQNDKAVPSMALSIMLEAAQVIIDVLSGGQD